jgi:hypothetical protein
MNRNSRVWTGLPLVLLACADEPRSEPLFELLGSDATGIDFVNEVDDMPGMSILNYVNFYNGGGVAAGDLDGDGLPELYFTSNLGPDRLYRNLGGYRFEDITEDAGLGTEEGWTSGVAMADVDGDGDLDIHLSTVSYLITSGHNVLYLNNGDATFVDATEAWGLDREALGTQAAFFDYDRDGDLDLYQLNHSTHEERGISATPQRDPHPLAGDRLLRNEGDRFVDVTSEAGIYSGVDGYGLGVVVSDLDADGCPDIYVANDFQENDFLYYNDCDGTFTESMASAMGHTSRSSMGVDAADIDNDGRPDIAVLDMLPEREEILKTSSNWDTYDVLDLRLQAGYHPQFAQNTLQLNRGARRFSEIAFLAGVHSTDWSWSPLLADFDNDGLKDLYVTNGIFRRPNDLDYIDYVGDEAVQMSLARGFGEENLGVLELMPQIPTPNYVFQNRGDLRFANRSREWGLDHEGYSTGAVYVDLDGTGALDLVVNNLNGAAQVYRNRSRERNGNGFLRVRLEGSVGNTFGIGAKVFVGAGGKVQLVEQMPTRGFQSSVDPTLHFGLGKAPGVDSVVVVWPDDLFEVLRDVAVNQELLLRHADASGVWEYGSGSPQVSRFTDVSEQSGISFRHRENRFFDFTREPLMPHPVSKEGPGFAVGDVDGDGLGDLFVGGAKHQAAALFVQKPDGVFQGVPMPAFQADSLHEDVDAVFFDADGDSDLDLYVVSAGNEFWGDVEPLLDRLYLNDGTGTFERSREALPELYQNGATVAPADFDGDGDIDLFVGGRVVSREYGRAPRSHLLENDGSGRFTDVTQRRGPDLAALGLVTGAAWARTEGEALPDLVVVGEFMPVRVFRAEGGILVDATEDAGLRGSQGWWSSVAAVDLDGDDSDDLVLGNLGLNSYLKASPTEPIRMYVNDFGRDGSLEQILTSYRGGVSYPLATRDELLQRLPQLRARFPKYADYGASRIEDIFPAEELRRADVLEISRLESSIAMRQTDGSFSLTALPLEAQLSPVYAIAADDFDGDGAWDLLLGGNLHGAQPSLGRYDASFGTLLMGDGRGAFAVVDPAEVGLYIDGQVRGLGLLRDAQGRRLVVVARNDQSLQIFLHTP